MGEQFWWHLARASGIVSWLMLTALVLWGIVLATDLFPEHRRPAWLLAAHKWLGWLSVGFIGVHMAALVADSYVAFGLVDLLVPFASAWKPIPVALGVIAMWGIAVVQATSVARKRFSKKTWRRIHLTSYGTYWLASFHGTFSGTDASNSLYVATSFVTLGAVCFAAIYRVLTTGQRRSPAGAKVSA